MFLKNYRATIVTSCMGYFIQAILVNFAPLLFVTFRHEFGLSLSQVSILISANFVTEFLIDFIASRYVGKIGYRKCIVFADFMSIVGLVLMAVLPDMMDNKFLALVIACIFCGMGGGFIEVLISPIVEACPTTRKSAIMSLLHSFYSWGQMSVVIISTVFFLIFGVENWRILSLIWAIVPLINMVLFMIVPINTLPEDKEQSKISSMLKHKTFWVFLVMMACAGASEIAMSQWASTFAEEGLGVEKWLGDLLGPCLFALCMGSARVFYAKKSEKINLENGIFISSIICIISYLITIFSPVAIVSLIGCAICGIGCGMLWPGTYSLATKRYPLGGVSMFGLLALLGDFGCTSGPFISGQVSSLFGGNLKAGFAVVLIFPITLAVMVLILKKSKNKN